jgi:hypothetical protein
MKQECGIERDSDGARICTLHKVALVQQSIQPIEPNPYGRADSVTGAYTLDPVTGIPTSFTVYHGNIFLVCN